MKVGPDEEKEEKPVHKWINKSIWLISTARNIIVVVFCAVMAYLFEMHESRPFILTGISVLLLFSSHQLHFVVSGHVKPGLPLFQPPPFETQVENKTYNAIEMVSTLGTAIFVVPLFGILENIALAKAFGKSEFPIFL